MNTKKITLNTIYSWSAEKFIPKIPDNFIDLTVTSPPYDNLRSYDSHFDLKLISKELLRATAQGGILVWVVADQTKNGSESGTSFKQALQFMADGWCLFDTMIWKKTNPMPGTKQRYTDEFEYMFVFSKGKPKTFNPIKVKSITAGKSQKWAERPHESKVWKKNGAETRATLEYKNKGNIWEYSTGRGGSTNDMIAFEHPAIFPEKLVSDHIQTWTNQGDVVCDFFSGSGTVAKVAYLMERYFICSDKNKKYVEIAKQRLLHYTNNLFNSIQH